MRHVLPETKVRILATAPAWLRDALVDVVEAAMHVDRMASTKCWHEYPAAQATLTTAKARLIHAVQRHTREVA